MPEGSCRVAVVCSEFNGKITDRMLDGALTRCREAGAEVRFVCRVPGAFDMPLFIKEFAERDDIDAVITLGAIVTGETKHDDVISMQLAASIAELSVRYGKPVSLGVSGPGMTWEQAEARAEEYAVRSVDAAIKMVNALRQARKERDERDFPAVIE